MAATIERRFTTGAAAGVEVRAAASGPGLVAGLAAVFYDPNDPGTRFMLWDDVEERVLPGAFDRALRERDDVRALVDHDPSRIIGRTTAGTARLAVDAKGLRYEADAPDTQVGRDIVTSIKRGDVTGSSFGFSVLSDQVKRETRNGNPYYIREILDVRLYDVSPVSFPAYDSTSVGARSGLPAEVRAAIVARAQAPAPSPESPEAMKAKADAAASKALADGQARARLLDLKERE